MIYLFLLLFFLSVVLFLISIVNPSLGLFWLAKVKTRRKALVIYGFSAVVFLIGIIVVFPKVTWAVQDQSEETTDPVTDDKSPKDTILNDSI